MHSVKTLCDRLGVSEDVGKRVRGLMYGMLDPEEESAAVRAWVEKCFGKPLRSEMVMCALNELLEGYGVEALRGATWWKLYFCDIVATYVNMGDPYTCTVIRCNARNRWYVCGYGDYIEIPGTPEIM